MNHNAGHIQVTDLSLKTKLVALSEQRDEPLNATIKAAIEAGIVALTKDDGSGRIADDGFHVAFIPQKELTHV